MGEDVFGRSMVPPLLRPGFAVRARLDARADPASVVTVRAPPGFGKTQLLVHWHRQAAQRGERVGWLSLPEGAGRSDMLGLLSALVSPGRPVARTLDQVLEQLAEQPSAWFIDDCSADTPLLAELAERLPPGSRLMLAGRCLPPLQGGPGTHVDVADLAFTAAEGRALLRARLPRAEGDRLSELERMCDGWPLGFNVAEAVLAGGTEEGGGGLAQIACDLSSLSASLVPAGLARTAQAALAEVSLLDAATAPLAHAATGRGDVADVLELGRLHGLLVAGDGGAALRPARYAADLLRGWRETIPGDRRVAIHRAAADWFGRHARPLDAIHHALAAGDTERAALLLRSNLLYMVAGGDFDRALAWVSAVPDARILADDTLRFSVALVHVIAGERREAERYRTAGAAAEQWLFRTLLANFADDPDTGAMLLGRIADPAAIPAVLRPLHANMTRWIDYSRGDFDGLEAEASPSGDETPEQTFSNCFKLFRQAQRHLAKGRASAAIAMLEEPLARAERLLGRDSFPATLLSLPLAGAWGQLGAWDRSAAAFAGRGLARGSQLAVDALALAMTSQARLAFAHGRTADGEAVIDRFLHIATERGLVRLEAMCLAERIRSRGADLGAPALTAALTSLLQIAADAERFAINGAWIRLPALLGAAHAARHAGLPDRAAHLLREAAGLARALGQTMTLAEIAILRGALPRDAAIAADSRPRPAAIDRADAATLAAQLGLALPPDLTIAPGAERPAAAADPVTIIATRTLPLALTAREEDVLARLMLSQSNKSIARALDLSHETVKWHVANLFDKLNVRDRRGLARRARELGLPAEAGS